MDFEALIASTGGLKAQIAQAVADAAPAILDTAKAIHADPELSFEEHRAADRLNDLLQQHDFEVTKGVADLPTSLVAQRGSGPIVVAIICEYDALPGLGHACGHNLIAGAGVAAGIGLGPLVDKLGITLRVIGTPAEEHGGGKVAMIESGVFDEVDMSLMIHTVQDGLSYDPRGTSSQAVGRYRTTFRGRAAHAAATPHLGVNAADAVVVTQVAVGLLRQQLPSDHRVALYVAEAGHVTNIIPETAVVEWECRAFSMEEFEVLHDKVKKCFEAGALATGCTVEFENTEPLYEPLIQDETLGQHWTDAIASLGYDMERKTALSGGSTDMGNVSRRVPSLHPWMSIPGATMGIHSHAYTQAADSEPAYEVMFHGGLAMAWAVASLVSSPADVERVLAQAAALRSDTSALRP
ncbi:amidohydrolase [Arthrobacter roseus]|uniref:amidohydrolase n=1 Tax=Arthrobacter roseus TaxID=136274 RepID=UPI001963C38B|nr:amidohydrolase [Arthrobacter roseus]MBM7846819.1 amidohydrolase [Arthrobacter roseus]